jgi:hypothetical protein
MPAKRPTGVTVIAILNIILGALGLLGGICVLGVMPALQSAIKPPAGPNAPPDISQMIEDEIDKQEPNHKMLTNVQLGLGIVLGLGLLVGGIGLWKLRPWGRTLTMAVLALELLIGLAGLGYAAAGHGSGADQRPPATGAAQERAARRRADPGAGHRGQGRPVRRPRLLGGGAGLLRHRAGRAERGEGQGGVRRGRGRG